MRLRAALEHPAIARLWMGQALSSILIVGGICFVLYALKAKQYEARPR